MSKGLATKTQCQKGSLPELNAKAFGFPFLLGLNSAKSRNKLMPEAFRNAPWVDITPDLLEQRLRGLFSREVQNAGKGVGEGADKRI